MMRQLAYPLKGLGCSLRIPFLTWVIIAFLSVLPSSATSILGASSSTSVQSDASALTPELSLLRSHLQAKNWQAADAETRRILQHWVGDVYAGSPTNVPLEQLRAIDQLWLAASNGRFGLSTQEDIWQSIRDQQPDMMTAIDTFGDRVGWRRSIPDGNNFIAPNWYTEPELNYSLDAPVGHLPWVGVDWAVITSILNIQSCGSCMIDAMALQGDRFYRYIPALLNQVALALAAPISSDTEAWKSLHSQYEINLSTLYPNNPCQIELLDYGISLDSRILAVSSYAACSSDADNTTVVLWNAQRGNRIITLLRGQAIATGSNHSDDSGQIRESRTAVTHLEGTGAIAIAFTPNSRNLVAGLSDGLIQLWTTDKGELVQTLKGHQSGIAAIAISADGSQLVSASLDQTIKQWNLQTGELIRTIRLNESDGIVHRLQISPDGRRLAIATNRDLLQFRDLATGQIVRIFVDSSVNVLDRLPITFSPDSQVIATSDIDYSIKLWNASTGARIITLKGHKTPVLDLAFSPDGRSLASSSKDYIVQLWNLQTYQQQQILNGAIAANGALPPALSSPGHLSFNHDSTILATSALLPLPHPISGEPLHLGGTILWHVSTGKPLTHIDYVREFSFSPNGQFLLTNAHTMQVWHPSP